MHYHSPAISAVLGPTNTGKTHLAIERMAGHSSGLIGFPLRLLAREVYDRIVALKGPKEVGLLTGEERIMPEGARWVCATVESMPTDRDFAFVALDEAQLGTDHERGHVFTDRLIHARGREETMILGSESLRPMVRALIPDAEITTRPRFSTLSYGGHKKLSRLPPRSAIVAFSAEQVYAVAELLRRFRGGAAIVMGALSPKARNAQVAMFQAGEVDYLVATDAIGMGLNLDVRHVAFASLSKFDGKRLRRLFLPEMAQIAGRAGRHQRDGTFGTLAAMARSMGQAKDDQFTPEEIESIETHQFAPIDRLYWREGQPRCSSIEALIADLSERPDDPVLKPASEAVDLAVLKRLSADPAIAETVRGKAMVERFWAACSLPDFRQLGADHHSQFIARLWQDLSQGMISADYAQRHIDQINNLQGDVGILSGRLAAIRSWSYIAQRADWLDKRAAIGEQANAVEERLSDALHRALTERFVDRRAGILMKKLSKDSALLPVTIDDDDIVAVDGEAIGRLDGFRLDVGADARLADRKMLLAAAESHLKTALAERAQNVGNADDKAFSIGPDHGGKPAIIWRKAVIALIEAGHDIASAKAVTHRSLTALADSDRSLVLARVQGWLDAKLAAELAPLQKLGELTKDETVSPALRALALQLAERAGHCARDENITGLLKALPAEDRQRFTKCGVTLGSLDIFQPRIIRASAQSLCDMLATGRYSEDQPEGLPSLWPQGQNLPRNLSRLYRGFGNVHLRIDLVERLIRKAHDARKGEEHFAIDPALALSMGLDAKAHHALLRTAGFRRVEKQTDQETDQEKPTVQDIVKDPDGTGATTSSGENRNTATQEHATKTEKPADNTPPKPSEASQQGDAILPAAEKPAIEETAPNQQTQNQLAAASDADETINNQSAQQAEIELWRWRGMAHARKRQSRHHGAQKAKNPRRGTDNSGQYKSRKPDSGKFDNNKQQGSNRPSSKDKKSAASARINPAFAALKDLLP